MVIVLYGKGEIPIGGILLFAAYFGDASSSLWELAWSLDVITEILEQFKMLWMG